MRTAIKCCSGAALVVALLLLVHPLWRAKIDCFVATRGMTYCFNPYPPR